MLDYCSGMKTPSKAQWCPWHENPESNVKSEAGRYQMLSSAKEEANQTLAKGSSEVWIGGYLSLC